MKFKITNTDKKARRGKMIFERGEVNTPAFMPVGTYGAVKAMTVDEVYFITRDGSDKISKNSKQIIAEKIVEKISEEFF